MIKTVLWDFDGVILDSMKVRDWGFKEIFKDFDQVLVGKLLEFHRKNGGLSRYVKIRYFFEKIIGKSVTEEEVLKYAIKFSTLMRNELTNSNNLILDSVNFIKSKHKEYNFHIVSGSDEEELKFLSKQLKIDQYFISIHGSPTPKNSLVANLLEYNNYNKLSTCLVGDSINDYEAAIANGITFFGYNNIDLLELGPYIYSFNNHNF